MGSGYMALEWRPRCPKPDKLTKSLLTKSALSEVVRAQLQKIPSVVINFSEFAAAYGDITQRFRYSRKCSREANTTIDSASSIYSRRNPSRSDP